MNKTAFNRLITSGLCALILLSSAFVYGTTVQVQNDTVSMSATGDTVTSANFPYGTRISGIKIMPGTGNCFYRLHVGSSTTTAGKVIYSTWGGSTTATLALDKTQFVMPNTGLYLSTNDAGTSLAVFLYSDVQ